MIRICNSLVDAGYNVWLIGRKTNDSIDLIEKKFHQKRLRCFFNKGFLFYAEYNFRLFLFLLFKKMDGICAIDLDTILACRLIANFKRIPNVYDAHELFCEMKEIVTRPLVYKIWKWIERKTVPHIKYAYTVNHKIAEEFKLLYNVNFEVIRSISVYNAQPIIKKEKYILYQGAVNEGRSFETLIPAMQWVDCQLIICGTGNFINQAKSLVEKFNLHSKVIFKGMIEPLELKKFTEKAYIGITLFEKDAKSNYYSLANRFFDYIHSTTPQLCVDYPIYREINNLYDCCVLIDDLSPESIAQNLNEMLSNDELWQSKRQQCEIAAKELNWQKEEIKLIAFYKNIFG
jgi:glycosyltransferase involved in cell wall biosynthesis